jgi:hypothetical protein
MPFSLSCRADWYSGNARHIQLKILVLHFVTFLSHARQKLRWGHGNMTHIFSHSPLITIFPFHFTLYNLCSWNSIIQQLDVLVSFHNNYNSTEYHKITGSKGCGRMRPWPNLLLCMSCCMEGLRKTIKISVKVTGFHVKIQAQDLLNTEEY